MQTYDRYAASVRRRKGTEKGQPCDWAVTGAIVRRTEDRRGEAATGRQVIVESFEARLSGFDPVVPYLIC